MSKALKVGIDYSAEKVIKNCIGYGNCCSEGGLNKEEKEKLISLIKNNKDIACFIYSAGYFEGYENW